MPKRVIILGSTGSIGRSALWVADNLADEVRIVGLAAGSRCGDLAEQTARYRPLAVALTDLAAGEQLRGRLAESNHRPIVLTGPDSLERLVRETDADFVLSAVVGVAGLRATLAAVERGLTVGLANKESLVVAGALLVEASRRSGAQLLPVDSEHSAVFQAMHAGQAEEVERIILTASGGPFRTWSRERMALATLDDAMRHPTWNMGPKITIDSATMMNKALEIIEAKWLFGIDPDRIEVVVHPESIIHSMVAFRDGSIVAQMGCPDMRTPIQYAMTYPRRLPGPSDRIDFARLGQMRFETPDAERFPALRLGHEVVRRGGTAGAAFNAANEAAVEAFREGRLKFLDIVAVVEQVLSRHGFDACPTLEGLLAVDAWARNEVAKCSSM